mgnify:CR=1 FL=1
MSEVLMVSGDEIPVVYWENTEPTIDNFWNNMKIADTLNSLQIILMLSEYYFKTNKDKGYKDYELELREHNLDVGLIAERVSDNSNICNMTNNYFKKKEDENFNIHDYVADYSVVFSCRPREEVISETLKHSESMEENLKKLEQTGVFVSSTEHIKDEPNVQALSEELGIGLAHAMSLSKLISLGKKKLILKNINPMEEFNNARYKNPGLEPSAIGFNNGVPVFGLVKDNKLVSPFGFEAGTIEVSEGKLQKYITFRSIA